MNLQQFDTTLPFPSLVGLCGLAGSGKSTLAAQLEGPDLGSFSRLSFATPIKKGLNAMGVPWHYLTDPRYKGDMVPGFGGRSARELMQLAGTEFGREMIHPDVWVGRMIEAIQLKDGLRCVIDDVRFGNEVKMIHSLGGVVIKVRRAWGAESVSSTHSSEMGVDCDYEIENKEDDERAMSAAFLGIFGPPRPL